MAISSPPCALVHSVESFGTVDGPGIRYVLFLQGCMLGCKYCHNKDACSLNDGITVDAEHLIGEVKRYREYLIASHGGVTVSGGEPLLQPRFIEYFFRRLGEYNIHRAIDTAGAVAITDDIKKVLKLTDLVLLDIKHIDNEKCIKLTGKSNLQTIEFARYLSMNDIPLWIRQVIVPGITDDENDLIDLGRFIQTLNNVQKVELLPYHNMGEHKWKELGLKYPLKNIREATQEDIDRAYEIIDRGRKLKVINLLQLATIIRLKAIAVERYNFPSSEEESLYPPLSNMAFFLNWLLIVTNILLTSDIRPLTSNL